MAGESAVRSTPAKLAGATSVSSSLNFGVEPLQFHAGVLDAELPINAALFRICFVGPRGDFALQFGQCPDATVTLDFALNRMAGVVENLVVYPKNMQKNLDRLGGLVHSQRVLIALTQKGVAREDAYRLVQGEMGQLVPQGP